MDVLEEVGGGDVGEVEGRVLAHEDHVEVGEVDRFEVTEGHVAAPLPPDLEGLGVRGEAPLAEAQVGREVVVQGVPAALRLEGEHERAVGVDVDTAHVVHLDGDGEGHGLGGGGRASRVRVRQRTAFYPHPPSRRPALTVASVLRSGS